MQRLLAEEKWPFSDRSEGFWSWFQGVFGVSTEISKVFLMLLSVKQWAFHTISYASKVLKGLPAAQGQVMRRLRIRAPQKEATQKAAEWQDQGQNLDFRPRFAHTPPFSRPFRTLFEAKKALKSGPRSCCRALWSSISTRRPCDPLRAAVADSPGAWRL